MTRLVAIALGSNLGDRRAHLDHAVRRLAMLLDQLRVSRFIETRPVGCPGEQPPYLNGAVVGRSALTARQLLEHLLVIEAERGRHRPFPAAPRTLDLDLILCGRDVIDEPDLQVPHPRFRHRLFVLEPLSEIAPDLTDPLTGLTIASLRERLECGATDGLPGDLPGPLA